MRALLTSFSGNDFGVMGRAIEARYARCQGWWEPHIRCTRDFIARNMEQCSRVAVLGAGRLLDLDLNLVFERADEVHLFDADPGCLAVWRRAAGSHFRGRVVPHIEDVTGVLDTWTQPLKAVARRGGLADYLATLEAPVPAWADGEFDGIISLNIAGQIPLYWRDRVLDVKLCLTDQERTALHQSMEALQCAHLRGLSADPTALRIIVTDMEYYYYDADHPQWEVEEALHGAAASLLEGCFGTDRSERWLWHLAPQYIEADNEGEIHRVEARIRTPATL
jgi:hypothetical protein